MPTSAPGADRRHRLRLGEDLGVRADADLEVLRPRALRDQRVLEPRGLRRARTHLREVVADDARRSRAARASARAGSPRACSSITRSSMLATKVTPAALIACRSQGASNHGSAGSRAPSAELASTAASGAMRGNVPARADRGRGVRQVRRARSTSAQPPTGRRGRRPARRPARRRRRRARTRDPPAWRAPGRREGRKRRSGVPAWWQLAAWDAVVLGGTKPAERCGGPPA